MSSPPPPATPPPAVPAVPATEPATPPADPTTVAVPAWATTMGAWAMGISVLVALYVFSFHLGAAVLSFQKYGSFLWAILDFLFPYIYYPYYAFVLSKEPAPVDTSIVGGARRMARSRRRRGFGTI